MKELNTDTNKLAEIIREKAFRNDMNETVIPRSELEETENFSQIEVSKSDHKTSKFLYECHSVHIEKRLFHSATTEDN